VPAIFEPWAHTALQTHPPAGGDRVLDVACGTGIGARLAAALVGRSGTVSAVDADRGMLAVARARAALAGGAAITCHQASALAMPFRNEAFDYVICLEGLQFFPDRPAGLQEMRRVLRGGGTLVATVWGPIEENPAYHAIAEGLRRFASADAARLPPFTLSDAAELRGLVSGAGFSTVAVRATSQRVTVPSADAFVRWAAAGGPTVRHNLAQLSDERRHGFDEFVAAHLAQYRTDDGLVVPSTRNVVIAE
jgi:SAM-dependent methyltransferase